MNMRGVDLNLLTILNVLLDEVHVSRASLRLGMSQPAVSSALDRCRHLFGDPLLERVGASMRLTAKAEALRAPLARIMGSIGELLFVEPIPLAELQQPVHIVMADALGSYLGRTLQEAITAAAPGINLVQHPWRGGSIALNELARGAVDLAVSVLPATDDTVFHAETLFVERYVAVMRHDHPAANNFDLDGWLAWPHVIVSTEGNGRTGVDDALAAAGLERRIGMVVPSFLLVFDHVRSSDMIALVPSLSMTGAIRKDFAVFEPPLHLDGFTLKLAWHRRRDEDPAVQFVAGEVRRLLTTV